MKFKTTPEEDACLFHIEKELEFLNREMKKEDPLDSYGLSLLEKVIKEFSILQEYFQKHREMSFLDSEDFSEYQFYQ